MLCKTKSYGNLSKKSKGRGVPPSAVEDAIQTGAKAPGNTPGTTVHSKPGLKIITNAKGDVISVIPQ